MWGKKCESFNKHKISYQYGTFIQHKGTKFLPQTQIF